MITFLKGTHKSLFLLFFISVLRAGLFVYVPFVFRDIINQISQIASKPGSVNNSQIYRNLIILAVVFAAEQILMFFNEKISDTVRMTTITSIRQAIFPKLMELSVDFIEKSRPGALAQKVNQGIFDFMDWLWSFNEWLSTTIISSIFILIALLVNNIYVGILMLVVCPIMVVINLRKVRRSKVYNDRANEYFEKYNAQLTESLSHASTIKSLSAEKEVNNLFNKFTNGILANRLKQFKIQRRHNATRDSIGAFGLFIAIAIITVMATKGEYTPGDILLVAYFARDLIISMVPIGRFIDTTGNTDVTTKRLIKLLNTKPTFEDPPDAKELGKLEEVEFHNVSFSYPDSKKGAVKDIEFNLKEGKSIALVGPSGVGKSTITQLLLRFYLPTQGDLLVNGTSANKFTQDSIRQSLAIVMQDVALFNTSVIENIKLAKPNATEQEITTAAKLAHAHEFIQELPKGYDTLVGERGIKLSGGQKQRIAIARAILKDPDLIILDEATSALDSQSEQLVQDGIKKLLEGRMSLIIAHRLSTIRHADEILVLEKGRVEERGTHEQLIKNNSLYAKLYKMQSETGKIEL